MSNDNLVRTEVAYITKNIVNANGGDINYHLETELAFVAVKPELFDHIHRVLVLFRGPCCVNPEWNMADRATTYFCFYFSACVT